MLNLKDKNISYILSSANNLNVLISYLHSRDYYLIDIKGYYQGNFENSILAFTNNEPNELRKDALHIMEHFEQECLIIKYKGESSVKKIFNDGSERPMGVLLYNTDSENKSYIYDGLSFSFVEQQLYYFPKERKEFKKGMIVEYFNKNKWIEKVVMNPDLEFSKLYSLLIKYNKIRIAV